MFAKVDKIKELKNISFLKKLYSIELSLKK